MLQGKRFLTIVELNETLPREVILAIAFMKAIHRTGLTSQAVVRKCSLKSGALKNFTNF